MQIKIIKRKASSYKELGHEIIEIHEVETLKELLVFLTIHEFSKQHDKHSKKLITNKQAQEYAKTGKITFGILYNEEKGHLDKAIQVMLQDFKDGLFRVYIDQKEYSDLNQKIELQDQTEIVLLRFVMLAGRLW